MFIPPLRIPPLPLLVKVKFLFFTIVALFLITKAIIFIKSIVFTFEHHQPIITPWIELLIEAR